MKSKRTATWVPKTKGWRCTVCRFQGRVLSVVCSDAIDYGTALCATCLRVALSKAAQPNGDPTVKP